MNDYISRQTVLRCIKESRDDIDWGQSEDGDAFLHYSAALYRTVASKECVPAADVVPVVRCRDCKHVYCRIYQQEPIYTCTHLRSRWNTDNDLEVNPDDFCSYGERSEQDG